MASPRSPTQRCQPNGLAASTDTRARHAGGKVLLCSAFSQDEALRQDGVSGHRLLRKPFTRRELLAEVHALLADAVTAYRPAAARAGLRG